MCTLLSLLLRVAFLLLHTHKWSADRTGNKRDKRLSLSLSSAVRLSVFKEEKQLLARERERERRLYHVFHVNKKEIRIKLKAEDEIQSRRWNPRTLKKLQKGKKWEKWKKNKMGKIRPQATNLAV